MSADSETSGPIHVGILIFEQVEVLDFAGPYEVFSRAPPRSRSGVATHG